MSDTTASAQAAAANLTTPPTPAPTPPAPDPAPLVETPTPTQGDKGNQDDGKDDSEPGDKTGKTINDLPDALKVIADLRAENARQRTTAKATAADEARQQIAADIAKALGIQPEGSEEPTDPATQIQELTAQVEAKAQAAREASLELSVYKAAQATGANPSALLDSRSFLSALADLDPADDKAVQAAITNALASNPNFRAVQATGPTRTDHAPGGPTSAQPESLEAELLAIYGN